MSNRAISPLKKKPDDAIEHDPTNMNVRRSCRSSVNFN